MVIPTHDFEPGELIELIDGELGDMPLGTRATVSVHLPHVSSSSVCYKEQNGEATWRPASYFKRVSPIKTEIITKTSLIEGAVGRILINKSSDVCGPSVALKFVDRNGKIIVGELFAGLNVVELRQVSNTLLELADFLEKQS